MLIILQARLCSKTGHNAAPAKGESHPNILLSLSSFKNATLLEDCPRVFNKHYTGGHLYSHSMIDQAMARVVCLVRIRVLNFQSEKRTSRLLPSLLSMFSGNWSFISIPVEDLPTDFLTRHGGKVCQNLPSFGLKALDLLPRRF